jgi:hypothetical protein
MFCAWRAAMYDGPAMQSDARGLSRDSAGAGCVPGDAYWTSSAMECAPSAVTCDSAVVNWRSSPPTCVSRASIRESGISDRASFARQCCVNW